MLGLTAHFPYLADLAEFRRQAEWKFLHYGNQLRQQGSVGGQSLAEEAEQSARHACEPPRVLGYPVLYHWPHWVSSPQVGRRTLRLQSDLNPILLCTWRDF